MRRALTVPLSGVALPAHMRCFTATATACKNVSADVFAKLQAAAHAAAKEKAAARAAAAAERSAKAKPSEGKQVARGTSTTASSRDSSTGSSKQAWAPRAGGGGGSAPRRPPPRDDKPRSPYRGKATHTSQSAARPKPVPAPPPPPPPPPPPALGYPPWVPPGLIPRRYGWPLFGLSTAPPITDHQAALASRLFQRGARFLGDHSTVCAPGGPGEGEPPWVELVFVGRSNVGKSTLLNALLGDPTSKFVPVSKHAGTTTTLDFYGVGTSPAAPPPLVLVDTPGYGFTRAGKGAQAAWFSLLREYLSRRSPNTMPRVVMLLDARVGATPLDAEVMAMLEAATIPWAVVLTKVDEVSEAALEMLAASTARQLSAAALPYPVLAGVSARSGEGLPQLTGLLVQMARLHRRLDADGQPLSTVAAAAAAGDRLLPLGGEGGEGEASSFSLAALAGLSGSPGEKGGRKDKKPRAAARPSPAMRSAGSDRVGKKGSGSRH